ncbi:sensor histidine kinase [Nakamurella aerolata]|uniref:Sensor-like histidine kinase SenX3 n=1 Tax=Nakamurella aerolata TaxID=1656892 RepID=A0A849A8V1_9ACTN|nr:ATP-binding protein [Nakamurella aerolata]NNG35501.1 two-component sensor histidine kinase [Nakamurella aerolata]
MLAAIVIRRVDGPRSDSTNADAALAAEVVRQSDSGYLVTDRQANVLLANNRAKELGVVRAGLADEKITDAIARAATSGEPVALDLGSLDGEQGGAAGSAPTGASVVHAVARPLRFPGAGYPGAAGAGPDDLLLVSAVDESAARRVEVIRRDFVANVSHELKTPVGAMALLAEAIIDGSDDPEAVRHFAGKMLAESTRLGTLVTELIALSRLQGGLPSQDQSVVQVDAVVDEATARLAMVAETAGIDVVSDDDSGLLVRGDHTLLVTALTNLIDNAISYSPAHTTVSVSRAVRGGQVEIAVTDRGIGIAPEHQKRVFERFFRVDPARSRATGGTGLGLAIVKHVAANHGGQALLFSRPGTGSTFTLRLPQLATSAVERTEPSSGPSSELQPEGAS